MTNLYFSDDLSDDEMMDLADYDDALSDDEYIDDDSADSDLLVNPIELIEGFRKMLSKRFRHLSVEALDESLSDVLDGLSPGEEFNFSKALSSVGRSGKQFLQSKAVGDIGRTVLPAAGTAIGTMYGGPAGTAIGGQLGQVAGQALFKGPKAGRGAASSPAQGGSAPAAQLLQLTQNPSVLNALGSLAMGSLGTNAVPLGNSGQSVPVGSIINMIGELARQASADADELYHDSAYAYDYLQDDEGEFIADPANPEARARALYAMLMQ